MTILSVVSDVCAYTGVPIPQGTTFPQTPLDRTPAELVALANEVAQLISYDVRDWTVLKKWGVINCDGVTTDWTLPNDFQRFLKTSQLYSSARPLWPLRFIPDLDDWMRRRLRNAFGYPVGEWTQMGTKLLTWPVQPAGVTLNYGYMHKNCVNLASGGVGPTFLADNDTFALPERLLKLGLIWRWKQQKGGAYAEDMDTYEDAIAMVAGSDVPSPILVGRYPVSRNAQVGYPWEAPYPGNYQSGL